LDPGFLSTIFAFHAKNDDDISMMGPVRRMVRGKGDVVLTRRMTQAEAISGFGRTAFALERFRGRGLHHSPEGDAWREYGGNTAHLPDANLRANGAQE